MLTVSPFYKSDCIAMNVMRKRGITDVLTHDTHFTQEGFHILR